MKVIQSSEPKFDIVGLTKGECKFLQQILKQTYVINFYKANTEEYCDYNSFLTDLHNKLEMVTE